MGLKSKEWFYKQCLQEVKEHTALTHLCWDILDKGIGQKDSTRGHVTQAIGAVQGFLEEFPHHLDLIKSSDPTKPFDFAANKRLLKDWIRWLSEHDGEYGKTAFGYNYSTLKNYLTPTLGGRRTGGGGGDDELKRVLRLIPEFLERA